jgi:uncharacterized membrane protein (GlpM family)
VDTLVFKLIITPGLITVATLAERRWGPTVGGWFVGLPLTSGPVSVFLALEQGRPFAATAARSSILGLVGVSAFCVGYARASQRFGPAVCLAIGFSAYTVVTLAARFVDGGPWLVFALVCCVLGVALAFMPRVPRAEADAAPPWWDLPLRIIAATGMVLLITAAASAVGPMWSGLLSPFPVFSSVLAAFAHHVSGSAAATRLQRGIIVGIYSFASFFLVVALLVDSVSLPTTYAAATLAALVVQSISFMVLRRQVL